MMDEQKYSKQETKPVKTVKVETIKNTYRTPFMICGHRIMPSKSYDLTSADKASKKGMARIENAIKKGYLERV